MSMPWAGIRGDAGKGILLQGVGKTLPACLLEADRASAGSLPYRHVRGLERRYFFLRVTFLANEWGLVPC